MLILKVNTEKEYFDLITDLTKYGVHQPNSFAKLDKDGMSMSDFFEPLTQDMTEEYLAVRDYEWTITTEIDSDGKEWEVEQGGQEGPLNRRKLHFCPELQKEVSTPTDKDYPILIMWEWGDDRDRCGEIATRYFDWISIATIPNSHNGKETVIKQTKRKWDKKYKKELEKLYPER